MVNLVITAKLNYTPEVIRLMENDQELVHAADIAPIIKMNPERIVGYVKEGRWPREICNYIISGRTVKFFRVDFLRKGGWI